MTTTSMSVEAAARRLVDGFSNIPAEWMRYVAARTDNIESLALPMWGTLFKVEDSVDVRKIRDLLRPIGPRACETPEELLEEIKAEGIEFDISPLEALSLAAENAEDDFATIREEVHDAWCEGDHEEIYLAMDGWQRVGNTGILAIEIDGELLLGVNSAGHSFMDAYWIPLYKALGYEWHEAE